MDLPPAQPTLAEGKDSGPFDGLQAEKARIPFANVGLVKVPDAVSDDQAILLSDIFPTGYMAAEMADILPAERWRFFGCVLSVNS
jgi:threonine dehydrogenase-like Zn-dependent dehydrogenase